MEYYSKEFKDHCLKVANEFQDRLEAMGIPPTSEDFDLQDLYRKEERLKAELEVTRMAIRISDVPLSETQNLSMKYKPKKAQRQTEVKKAIQFFTQKAPENAGINDPLPRPYFPIRHPFDAGEILVEEVRRLRSELKKANRGNERLALIIQSAVAKSVRAYYEKEEVVDIFKES